MATNASFNASNLQTFNGTNGILVQDIQHAGKNQKAAQTYALSHGNKSSIPFVEYPSKPITLTGQIIGSSISDCDTQIDTFNGLLTVANAALCFDYAGGSLNRQYTATATNINVNRPGGLAWANFDITFTATSPFGQDITTSNLITAASGQTAATASFATTAAGNAPFQTPLITITYTAIGSAPVAGSVTIGNDSTGQTIVISRTFAATDVLVIDCTLSTTTPVTVNGVGVDFSGALPDFAPGSGHLDYSDSFASRSYGITATYFKQYV